METFFWIVFLILAVITTPMAAHRWYRFASGARDNTVANRWLLTFIALSSWINVIRPRR